MASRLVLIFLSPVELPGASWLLLLLPLSLGVSIVYRGTRMDDLRALPVPVLRLWGEIVVSLLALGVGVYVFLAVVLD